MNPVLAQLYGTGLEKVAYDDDYELDLDNISAADFLALMEDEEDFEKEAFDLSDLSAAELMELWEEADELDEYGEIEKMAADGTLDYFDTAGRIMAHAYADEMGKFAGADEIDVDLEAISGEDLMELLEAGYEFVDTEKTAASLFGRMARTARRSKAPKHLGGGKLTAEARRELRAVLKAQSMGYDRTAGRGRKAREAAQKAMRKRRRTGRGLSIEAAMRTRDLPRYAKMRGGQALEFGKKHKKALGGGAAAAAALGAGAAYKRRNR